MKATWKSVRTNILQRERKAAITRERKWQNKQIKPLLCQTIKSKQKLEEDNN